MRINGAIFQNNLAQAVITVAAVFGWQYLAKVGQQGVATTGGTIAIGQNLLQLLMGKKLFVLTRFLSNNVLDLEAVTRVKKEDSLGWKAITTWLPLVVIVGPARSKRGKVKPDGQSKGGSPQSRAALPLNWLETKGG